MTLIITNETLKPKRSLRKTVLVTTLAATLTITVLFVGFSGFLQMGVNAAEARAVSAETQVDEVIQYMDAKEAMKTETEALVQSFATEVRETLSNTTPANREHAFDTLVMYSQVLSSDNPKMVGTPEHHYIELTNTEVMGDDMVTVYYAVEVADGVFTEIANATEIK